MIRDGKTALGHSGHRSVIQGSSRGENRDVSCHGGVNGHWGSKVFLSGRGDEDVIRVYSDIFMERSEEEGVKEFSSDLRRSGGHCVVKGSHLVMASYNLLCPGFCRGMFGWFS